MDIIKMKPFNLEEAKAGKPIITRDGRKVKFVAYEPMAETHSVAVLIAGRKTLNVHRTDGRFYDEDADSEIDLFMASVKQKVYTVVYKIPLNGQKFTESYTTSSGKEAAINTYSVYNWEVVAVFENEYEEE